MITSLDEAIKKLGYEALLKLINRAMQIEMSQLCPRPFVNTAKAEAIDRILELSKKGSKHLYMSPKQLLDMLHGYEFTPEDHLIVYLITCISEALDDKRPNRRRN